MSCPGAADPGAAVERLCRELNLDAASAAEALRDFTALRGTYSLEVSGAGWGRAGGDGRRPAPAEPAGRGAAPLTAAPVPAGRSAALVGLRAVRRLPPEPRAHRGEQPDGGERRLPDPHPALRTPQVSAPPAGRALPVPSAGSALPALPCPALPSFACPALPCPGR